MENKEILTISEVADYLKISLAQAYRFIDRKENPLPIINISDKTKRVRMVDLQTWLSSQRVKSEVEKLQSHLHDPNYTNPVFDEVLDRKGGEQ